MLSDDISFRNTTLRDLCTWYLLLSEWCSLSGYRFYRSSGYLRLSHHDIAICQDNRSIRILLSVSKPILSRSCYLSGYQDYCCLVVYPDSISILISLRILQFVTMPNLRESGQYFKSGNLIGILLGDLSESRSWSGYTSYPASHVRHQTKTIKVLLYGRHQSHQSSTHCDKDPISRQDIKVLQDLWHNIHPSTAAVS